MYEKDQTGLVTLVLEEMFCCWFFYWHYGDFAAVVSPIFFCPALLQTLRCLLLHVVTGPAIGFRLCIKLQATTDLTLSPRLAHNFTTSNNLSLFNLSPSDYVSYCLLLSYWPAEHALHSLIGPAIGQHSALAEKHFKVK